MKRDLDRLMAERNLDGFLVLGEGHGPVMRYLTSGGYFEGALLLKPRGEEVTLVHGMMERGYGGCHRSAHHQPRGTFQRV